MTFDAVYVLPAPARRTGQTGAREPREDLRIPLNSNNIEALDDLQSRYFAFSKIHSQVLSRRPSLMAL